MVNASAAGTPIARAQRSANAIRRSGNMAGRLCAPLPSRNEREARLLRAPVEEADARTRTADPFITSEVRLLTISLLMAISVVMFSRLSAL